MRKNVLFILCLTLCPFVAVAQNDTILIKEVEVRGVHRGGGIQSTIPRQQIDRSAMLRQGITNIEEALKHMAGITVKDYGGAGGMKTVSVRGIGSKHTAVVYDGLALTDCQTGEIDLSRYSLSNMQCLRLTIGDGDNIFVPARQVSSAAVLEMETDMGDNKRQPSAFRATITGRSWNTVEPSFFYRHRLADGLYVNLQGEYIHTDNNYPFTLQNVKLVTRERRQNSRMDSGHMETNVVWQANERNCLMGKLYYYDNNRQLPGIVRLYTQDNDEQLRERNAFGQLRYQGVWFPNLSMRVAAKVNWVASLYRVGIPSGGVKSERYWQREYYVTTSWLYSPTTWLGLNYSIDYALNNLNSTLTTPTSWVDGPISVRPYRHSLLQTLAGKMVWGRLTGVARLLWSNYMHGVARGSAPDNARRWSPSVSMSYRLMASKQLYVRFFWKNIFRMPTFNELFFYHIGSPTLRPENSNQFNVGLTGSLDGMQASFRFTADGYYAWVKDKIVAVPFNMFVWSMMNISKVNSYGLDFTANAEWRVSKKHSLELATNYSLQRVGIVTIEKSPVSGNQIPYVPKHSFAATLNWQNMWLNASVTIDGMSARWTTNEHAPGTRIAGFAEASIAAYKVLRLKSCSVTVRGGVQNLLDKQYDIVAHYPMPGRSWTLSAQFEM